VINESIFKQYDIRGSYPSAIDADIVYAIALSMAYFVRRGDLIVAAHDARESSPDLYNALLHGLRDAGLSVVEAGLATSPMVTFLVHSKNAEAGMMITASHNPKDQNGLKIVTREGVSLGGREMARAVDFSKKLLDEYRKKGAAQSHKSPFVAEYAGFLSSLFNPCPCAKKMPVVIDCSHGSAGPIIQSLAFPPHLAPIILHAEPDGAFPAHSPNPLLASSHIAARKAVLENKAAMAVIFDGDGDRAVFLDDKGKAMRPEHMWRLMAHEAPSSVVTELNWFLVEAMLSSFAPGAAPEITRSGVGHRALHETMERTGAAIGFENSGHYYFKEFFQSDSGIVAFIKAASALSSLPYGLSDFSSLLPRSFRFEEQNVPMRQACADYMDRLRNDFENLARRIEASEGISFYFKDVWANVRPSHTEEMIRINVEGYNRELMQVVRRRILKSIKI
jgi:phosphomannomutase